MNMKIILLLLLTTVFAEEDYQHVDYQRGDYQEDEYQQGICDITEIPCICMNQLEETYVNLRVKRHMIEDRMTGEKACSGNPNPFEACENISCVFDTSQFESYEWENNLFSDSYHPHVIYYAPGEIPNQRHLWKRASAVSPVCTVPRMQNAFVTCWLWPFWKTCSVDCINGYAHPTKRGSVRSKAFGCRSSENKWRPPIRDCKPYFTCAVYITDIFGGASLNCTDPLIAPPYCNISCWDEKNGRYTDYKRHTCIEGKYQPPLPHCVELENVKLISPPNSSYKYTAPPFITTTKSPSKSTRVRSTTPANSTLKSNPGSATVLSKSASKFKDGTSTASQNSTSKSEPGSSSASPKVTPQEKTGNSTSVVKSVRKTKPGNSNNQSLANSNPKSETGNSTAPSNLKSKFNTGKSTEPTDSTSKSKLGSSTAPPKSTSKTKPGNSIAPATSISKSTPGKPSTGSPNSTSKSKA